MLGELKIVDISTVLAGPSVATFFAELGAEVKKIEHPTHGDVTRTWKLPSEKNTTVSAYFSSVNYKKKYIKLDLSLPDDRSSFLELVKNADILISNFKKGDAEKFGIENNVLVALNQRLIHAKITGFGADSDRVAYDLVLQAETGFMAMNGTKESGPVKMPVALIDVLAAHQLKEAILLALFQRERTGKGASVEVSLYRAAIASLMNQASNYLMENILPKRQGSLHPNIAPYGEIFQTKDQFQLTFAIGSDLQFKKLCDVINAPEIDQNTLFTSNLLRIQNRGELALALQLHVAQFDSDFILCQCEKYFIPAAKIRSLDEVIKNELAQAMIREEEIEGKLTRRITSIAFNYDGN
jgi:crotonobetainyl-CoA:carnitine CoA-transferase CaiB-like acyl-CoA transferase